MARLHSAFAPYFLYTSLMFLIFGSCGTEPTGIPLPDNRPGFQGPEKADGPITNPSDNPDQGVALYGPDAGSDEPFETDYECEPFTEEACVTECGSNGWRRCGKNWGPCEAPIEECNGLDDDCDGVVDNGVANACGSCGPIPEETCNGIDDNCDGQTDEGVTNACGTCGLLTPEVCNGTDDDCDGQTDEGLLNACGACGAVNIQEDCNGVDDNCDGQIDEDCTCLFELNINDDCVFLECPAQCPFPVACDLQMHGGDHRGCVASQPDISVIYLQEGNQCSAGHITGTITCGSTPGAPLNQNNCPINKPQPIHTYHPFLCPETN